MAKLLEEAAGSRGALIVAEKEKEKEKGVGLSKNGKPARPQKTKEELDKEMAEILWKINCLGRIKESW